MKLLTEELRRQHFKYLGLGEYNNTNLRKLQKTYLRTKDVDGVYGPETDKLLRHLYNVKKCAPSFKPTEFRCTCGHCNGYPSYMKRVELRHLQKIRDHYDRPMIVTSGLRCKHANGSSTGSIQNSLHLVGRACDFYIAGVTDTLANRKKAIKYIKTLPNHHYTYGNGINSNGVAVSAPYMGNALHTDVNREPKKAVDPLQKWYDEMKVQFNWSKNQAYKFVTPTVESSKKNGTCITFPSVTLQRLELLPKGKYFYYHPQHKRISGSGAAYVKNHPEIFAVFYPHKTIKQLWKAGKIKKGDIVGYGNPGYHTMVFMGLDSKGRPRFNTMGHKRGLNVLYPSYANRKVDMIVRIKKV
jgi:hypothetical protein